MSTPMALSPTTEEWQAAARTAIETAADPKRVAKRDQPRRCPSPDHGVWSGEVEETIPAGRLGLRLSGNEREGGRIMKRILGVLALVLAIAAALVGSVEGEE